MALNHFRANHFGANQFTSGTWGGAVIAAIAQWVFFARRRGRR